MFDEIENAKRTVNADTISYSIGELINLFRDDELVINPKFQRMFRWSLNQKTSFIESILIGLPLPPLFCFELPFGMELIDGLQRVSTLMQFTGELEKKKSDIIAANRMFGNIEPEFFSPFQLSKSNYIPSLTGTYWSSEFIQPDSDSIAFPKEIQFALKRARIDVQILKRPTDNDAKFDLFERLNSGGTSLTAQELRSSSLILLNELAFDEIVSFANYKPFKIICDLSEAQIRRQEDVEIACRGLAFFNIPYEGRFDLEEYITTAVKYVIEDRSSLKDTLSIFRRTSDVLVNALQSQALQRYYVDRDEFRGRVGRVAFEAVFVGVAKNVSLWEANPQLLADRLKAFWSQKDVTPLSSAGVSGTARIQKSIPLGSNWFSALA